jgi:TP53 regulating kinase-like protein
MNKLIAQGAEAKIFLENNKVQKSRIVKSYRHPIIDDNLRKRRTKSEAKILSKALKLGISVPRVLDVNKYDLEIEYICGDRLSEKLDSYPEKKQFSVMEKIGKETATLHKNDIIHGDLTTSNILLKENKVFIIDFGLGFFSKKLEDKAVDLHLIKQALEAKHYQNNDKLFEGFLKGYNWKGKKLVLERLQIVEKRGRYRH